MSTSPPAKLPVSLAANPRLSSWVQFAGDGAVTVSPGKVEIGQGIVTALAQIAADELDIDLSRVPERGRHLGQSFDPAVRTRASPGLRRNPANLS
jgi:xanthine dehydrogenase molybdopterin-binding subunit B